jgi:hypothetical protein
MVRLQPPMMAALDAWIASLEDEPSRPEAIRRLLGQALARQRSSRSSTKLGARTASDLAAREVERVKDRSLPPEEHARRKRALILGPKEFREVRSDLPNKRSR